LARLRTLAWGLAASLALVAAETTVCRWLLADRVTDVAMVFLLGVFVIAIRFGYVPSLVTTLLGVASFDFFFTPPLFSLSVDDKRYLITFLIMGFVAFVTSNLTERVRRHSAQVEAMALERARLAEEAQRVHEQIQNERLRNALLSSVSHDLRTPLSVVQGAATALLENQGTLSDARRTEYLRTISDEAGHLNRLVRNLLDMTALQSGSLRVRKSWHPLEEIIGIVFNRLEEALGDRPVKVEIADEVTMVSADATLLQQVLINLVDNASRYTPIGSPIQVFARNVSSGVEIEVADSGPGVPAGQEEAVFEKFHRGVQKAGGMGLGLTICRGIITAHGGKIWCENRAEGGASFRFVLPLDGGAPKIESLPEAVEAREDA
jgi:K+-sensing histidine kinase KdpD